MELHQEGFAPEACAAGFFLDKTHQNNVPNSLYLIHSSEYAIFEIVDCGTKVTICKKGGEVINRIITDL